MKLPDASALREPEHRYLYHHDLDELHNPNRRDFTYLMYIERFRRVLEAVGRFRHDGRVLDIGCAQGNFALGLAERGFNVVAFDRQFAFLTYLNLKLETGHVTCVNGSLDRLPFQRGRFDIVLLGEVIEHVAYPEKLVSDAVDLLAERGLLVITTPNGGRLHTKLPNLSSVPDRATLVPRQFQPDADGHLFVMTQAELLSLAQQTKVVVKAYDFFTTPWLSGRLGFRHLCRFLPVPVRALLDRWMLRVPALARLFSEGQLMVAVKA